MSLIILSRAKGSSSQIVFPGKDIGCPQVSLAPCLPPIILVSIHRERLAQVPWEVRVVVPR